MSKILLLFTFFLTTISTLCFGQTGISLGRANSFSALAATKIQANGPGTTTIYGYLGTSPGKDVGDMQYLNLLTGRVELDTELAQEAMRDAQVLYNTLRSLPVTASINPSLGGGNTLGPGVYQINGDATLSGTLLLDGQGNFNSVFVFIIDGSLRSNAGSVQLSEMGASAKNVYWVVQNGVDIGAPGFFQGNIIARQTVTLGNNVTLIGRAISLEKDIVFNANLLALQSVVEADLEVKKETDATDVSLGSYVTYTITAKNNGPGVARNVAVRERIPLGLRFVRAEGATKGYYDTIVNQWVIGDMVPGDTERIKVVFEITGTGNIRNEVVIIGDDPDPNPKDDEDDAVLPELPDLALTKTITSQPPYYVGDVVTYTLTVTNKANSAQNNVRVQEQLPEGLEFTGFSAPDGVTYDPVTNIFSIPTVAGNSAVTIALNTKLLRAGTIRNIATILDRNNDNDKDPGNDKDDEEIVVTCRELNVALTTTTPDYCGLKPGLTITATEVIGATYTWALPTGWVLTSGNGTNSIVVTPNALGGEKQVTVTVKDQCNAVVVSAPITIAITGTPDVPVINGGNSVCFNATEGTEFSTSEAAGFTYTWEVVSGGLKLNGQGARVRVLPLSETDLQGGVVRLTVTNSCGLSNVATKAIIVTPAPGKPGAITGDINLCESRNATFSVAEVAGAASYTWAFPSDWKVVDGANSKSVTVTVGKESGEVSVRAVNECSPGEAMSKFVTVVPQPTAENFKLNSDKAALCEGEELVLTADVVANAQGYEFAVTGGLQIVNRTGNTVRIKAGTTGGSVSVTITDFCNRTLTVSKDITVTPKLTPVAITSGATEVCRNSTGNIYTATAYNGPVTYKWTVSGDLSITKGEGTGQVEVSAGTAGGNLTVEVDNGCFTVTNVLPVKTITPPTLPTLITGSNDVCEGSTVTYSVPNVAGVTYTWTAPAGWTNVGTSTGASVSFNAGPASGRLLLTAADGCGNSKEIGLDVTVTRLPVAPTISGPATACAGQDVTYTLTGAAVGVTYTWSATGWSIKGASTGNSITVVAGSGAGTISVTASNKCLEVGSSMAVGITPVPASPGAVSHDVNVCQNSTGNVISVAEVPGATSYSWNLPLGWQITAGHNTNRITVTTTETGGLVSVTANNCTGASTPTTTTINITRPPAPVTRITDNSNVCDGLVYTADLVNDASSYTWTVTEGFTIESGQGTATIKVKANNPNAVGRVGVTAFTGTCAGAAEYSIDMDARLADGQLDFPKAFSPNGDGKNDTWLVRNLEKFPDNELVIFNRWGSEVFKQKNYKNDWAAQGLGQGTYFYKVQVKLCDGKYQEYSGYLTVFR